MRYAAAPKRRDELLRDLREVGYVSSSAAAAAFGVSEMTIRRDLRRLADEGRARRVVGGASRSEASRSEESRSEEGRSEEGAGRPFERRRADAAEEKDAVARRAVPLLGGARVVALDAGTTVGALARLLPGDLTVVTHSVPAILACTARTDVELIGLGGTYHAGTRSFTGPATRAGLAELAVDVAVLSAVAVGRTGTYSADPWDADTKRAMAAIAARVVLLIDHHKLAARAPMRVLGLDLVDTVVVDDGIAATDLAMLRDQCREVVVAARR